MRFALTAIACSIAEGFYGIPKEISDMALLKLARLDELMGYGTFLTDLLAKWESWRA